MDRNLHIALTFDDRYWALAYATMRSICLTTTERKRLVFHLLHMPLRADHAAILNEISAEFGASLFYYDLINRPDFLDAVSQLPSDSRFPIIVYARLLLDLFLPPEVDRVLYLDCDVLVRRPVEELYDIDLNDFTLAAVTDAFHDDVKLGREMKSKGKPFDPADPYFNAGVMLINRHALANANIAGHIIELCRTGIMAKLFYDQDILNYVFRGRWLELDTRFNQLRPYPSHETLGVHIVHYTGNDEKPWYLLNRAAFSRTYRHVMTNRVFYKFWRERMSARVRKFFRLGSK